MNFQIRIFRTIVTLKVHAMHSHDCQGEKTHRSTIFHVFQHKRNDCTMHTQHRIGENSRERRKQKHSHDGAKKFKTCLQSPFGCDSQPSSMFSQQDTCSMAVRYSSNKSEPCLHVSCCTLLPFFFFAAARFHWMSALLSTKICVVCGHTSHRNMLQEVLETVFWASSFEVRRNGQPHTHFHETSEAHKTHRTLAGSLKNSSAFHLYRRIYRNADLLCTKSIMS